MADQFLGDDGHVVFRFIRRLDNFPIHLRRDGRHAAVDLAVEVLDNLGPPLVPPLSRRRDFLAIFGHERIRQFGNGFAFDSS